MKKGGMLTMVVTISLGAVIAALSGCSGNTAYLNKTKISQGTLLIEEVDPNAPIEDDNPIELPDFSSTLNPGDQVGQSIPPNAAGLHPLFNGSLGLEVSSSSLEATVPDSTGQTVATDYDGDGIPNDEEIITNPYVADYPRIVTRIAAPVTMEIRAETGREEDNFSETLNESSFQDTSKNSMEDKHYSSANKKTTPYVVKESESAGGKDAGSYGYTNSSSDKWGMSTSFSAGNETFFMASGSFSTDVETSRSKGENSSFENEFSRSNLTEKTTFEDVDYVDNLDRNGIEYTNDTIEKVSKNFRQSNTIKLKTKIGPNAGFVTASLYLKNPTLNMPAKVGNVMCTLSFRTPSGRCESVKTFLLRNDDYSVFSEEIYGGEELGPYTIEVGSLNTAKVMEALSNGQVPQIHVISYTINKVKDTNYNPGVDNLKIVEEITKARTAVIKIVGQDVREMYRVAAFDVDSYGNLSPGISLKKALFNILHSRIGSGETWERDKNGRILTVTDANLNWIAHPMDENNHIYSTGGLEENVEGNSWDKFETYVKSYTDAKGNLCRTEAIKRIDALQKYIPFDVKDNPYYDPNEQLARAELLKTKFWVIMYEGKEFKGDLNDPIWAGDRFELVLMDMQDFNEHITRSVYTPFQSRERFLLDTRWNALTEEKGEFARAVYLGKIFPGEVVQLEVNLLESRYLLDVNDLANGFGTPSGSTYSDFKYTFEPNQPVARGIPGNFNYSVEGLTNSIRVKINASQNAESYDIRFYPFYTDPTTGTQVVGTTRTVNVSPTTLENSAGVITLSSQTYDSNGTALGLIEKTRTNEAFRVEVDAVGTYCNNQGTLCQTERTQGISTRNVAEVKPALANPEAFRFRVEGKRNTLQVILPETTDVEYYTIRYEGPFNYPRPAGASATEVIGYAGVNSIHIPSPSVPDLVDNDYQAGLYHVLVYAHNKRASSNGVGSANGQVSVEIPFDRYERQRMFAPKINATLFDLRAVDLEVHFNDNNGWHKLLPYNISTYQTDPDLSGIQRDSTSIECFYSSYFYKQEQKFIINFYPPYGNNGLANIFEGGKSEADVYIRTVPRMKYRDSFWIRKGRNANNVPFTLRLTSPTPNPVASWLKGYNTIFNGINNNTDATNLEVTLPSYSDIVSSQSPDNYFFSPLVERVYSVRANVNNEIQIVEGYRPNAPGFAVAPLSQPASGNSYYTNPHMKIFNISSANADWYTIYYIEGMIDTYLIRQKANSDATGVSWINSVSWKSKSLSAINGQNIYPALDTDTSIHWSFDKTSNGITLGKNYTVCVAASNEYGVSIPECKYVNIPTQPADAVPGTPSIGNTQSLSDRFLITGISGNNCDSFKVYYKDNALVGDDVDSPPWTAVSIPQGQTGIAILVPAWKDFLVRVYGFNSNNKPSDNCAQQIIRPPAQLRSWQLVQSPQNGTGRFRTTNYNLRSIINEPLTPGIHFNWGSSLDSLFDRNKNGDFAPGKCFRIVVGGKNLLSEMGLTSIAQSLAVFTTPPGNVVYIDPVLGKFSLPQPIYWNRCESIDNIRYPDIIDTTKGTPAYDLDLDSVYFYMNDKNGFGQNIIIGNNPGNKLDNYIYPFGQGTATCPAQGTISLWARGGAYDNEQILNIHLNSNTYIQFFSDSPTTGTIKVFINGTQESQTSYTAMDWHHMYITWHTSAGLSNYKTIRIWLDGNCIFDSTAPFTTEELKLYSNFSRKYEIGPYIGNGASWYIDNIKVWDHVVVEDPSWEYNGGAGREDALHFIYGPDYGYNPHLESPASGVGYFLPW